MALGVLKWINKLKANHVLFQWLAFVLCFLREPRLPHTAGVPLLAIPPCQAKRPYARLVMNKKHNYGIILIVACQWLSRALSFWKLHGRVDSNQVGKDLCLYWSMR